MELLDSLLFAELANEQGVVFFGYDETVEPLYDNFFLLGRVYDTVVGVEKRNVLSDDPIAEDILLGVCQQGAPSAYIAPAEIGRADVDFFGFFHDGIVHGDAFALWVSAVDFLLFFWSAVNAQHALKDAVDRGLIDAEGVDDGVDVQMKMPAFQK